MNKKMLMRWALWPSMGVLMIGLSQLLYGSDYMTERTWDAEVMGKYITYSKHGRERYHVKYKLLEGHGLIEKGHRFDLISSEGAYRTSHNGQVNSVERRQIDIKQTGNQNLLFFFLPALCGSIGFTLLLVPFISAFFRISDPEYDLDLPGVKRKAR